MQTVGDILRAAREEQGISVKNVEKATSIRTLYIQAIEEGNYKIMPGEVYLKGFIRNYASFLGLNGQEMVELYRQSLPPEPAVVPELEIADKRRKISSGPSRVKWPVIIVALLILAVCWLVWSFYSQQPLAPPSQPAPQSQQAPQPPTAPVPAPVPPPAAPSPAVTPVTPTGKQIVVVAKYAGQSWTLVTADGREIYEGTPRTGETLTWSADQNVTVRFGNAAAVDLTVNGQPQAKMGAEGEVVVKTFSADPATIKKP